MPVVEVAYCTCKDMNRQNTGALIARSRFIRFFWSKRQGVIHFFLPLFALWTNGDCAANPEQIKFQASSVRL